MGADPVSVRLLPHRRTDGKSSRQGVGSTLAGKDSGRYVATALKNV